MIFLSFKAKSKQLRGLLQENEEFREVFSNVQNLGEFQI